MKTVKMYGNRNGYFLDVDGSIAKGQENGDETCAADYEGEVLVNRKYVYHNGQRAKHNGSEVIGKWEDMEKFPKWVK